MFNIGQYFEKFAKLGLKNEFVKNSVVEVVQKITGITLTFNSIEYKNNSLTIKAHPAIKNTILIKKKEIVENLRSLGVKVDDIR